jgi:hypothetical protein
MPEIEYDEYLQIWSMSAQSALECFGLASATHEVVVLKDKPETAREIERYKPDAKLYGIKSRISLTADTLEDL